MTDPFIFWNESKPIKYKTHKISEEYNHHKTSKEPEVIFRNLLIAEKIFCIYIDAVYDIETESTKSRKFVGSNSEVQDGNNDKKHNHEYPCREYSIGNM